MTHPISPMEINNLAARAKKRFSAPVIDHNYTSYQSELMNLQETYEENYTIHQSASNLEPNQLFLMNNYTGSAYYSQAPGLSPPSSVPNSLSPASTTAEGPYDDSISLDFFEEQNKYELSTDKNNQNEDFQDESDSSDNMQDGGNDDAFKKKRRRTSPEQLRILVNTFLRYPMPSLQMRVELSKKLGMTPRAVQVWFQNRRAKEKMDHKRAEYAYSRQTLMYPSYLSASSASTTPAIEST